MQLLFGATSWLWKNGFLNILKRQKSVVLKGRLLKKKKNDSACPVWTPFAKGAFIKPRSHLERIL